MQEVEEREMQEMKGKKCKEAEEKQWREAEERKRLEEEERKCKEEWKKRKMARAMEREKREKKITEQFFINHILIPIGVAIPLLCCYGQSKFKLKYSHVINFLS